MPTLSLHRIGLVLFCVFVLIHTMSLPLGEAADEPDHLAVALLIAEKGHPPLSDEERAAGGIKGGLAPFYYQIIAQIIQFVDRSPLPELRRLSDVPERYIPEDGLSIARILHTIEEKPPYQGIVLAWHLARLISLVFALGTLVITYRWSMLLFKQSDLAVGITLFVAFLPRFMINSAVINDDNLVTFLIVLFLYVLVGIVKQPEDSYLYFVGGIVFGFAVLTKYYSFILALDLLLLFGYLWRKSKPNMTHLLQNGLWLCFGFFLIAGPWLIFIIVRFNRIAELGFIPGLAATLGEPQVTDGLVALLNGAPLRPSNVSYSFMSWATLLFKSFWFEYGWMTLFASNRIYGLFALLCLLSLLGWGLWLKNRGGERPENLFPYILSTFHLGLFVFIVLGRYGLSQTIDTGQGRHLFPALPVIGFFFMGGLKHLFRRIPFQFVIGGYSLLCIISSFVFLQFTVKAAYPYLPIAHKAQEGRFSIEYPLHQSVNERIDFLGYNVPSTVRLGDALPVTLYWQAKDKPQNAYWLKACLSNMEGQPVSCRQGYPVQGRYPTRSWEVDDVIEDGFYLPIINCVSVGSYTLSVSLNPLISSQKTIQLASETHFEVSLGQINVIQAEETPRQETQFWYQNQQITQNQPLHLRDSITVIEYVDSSTPIELIGQNNQIVWQGVGEPLSVLCSDGSQARMETLTVDYTVFPDIYRSVRAVSLVNQRYTQPEFEVEGRLRNFATSQTFSKGFNDILQLEITPPSETQYYPGQVVPLDVTWQAQEMMATPYVVSLLVLDKNFDVAGERNAILGDRYPNVLWAPDEVVPERYFIPLRSDAPPGHYQVEFSLLEILPEDGFKYLSAISSDTSELVQEADHFYPVRIRIFDPKRAAFAPTQERLFSIGSNITLTGFDVETITDTVALALYWQNEAVLEEDYTVFTQLIGPDGKVWGQRDNQPQDGRYPTYLWQANDKIVDRFQIPLREGAPPGEYRLLVGMYQLETGERLHVLDAYKQGVPDNAISLTTLRLTESGFE